MVDTSTDGAVSIVGFNIVFEQEKNRAEYPVFSIFGVDFLNKNDKIIAVAIFIFKSIICEIVND